MLAPVSVTLLSGFLGSGKTTLLNRWLRDPGGERLAVVVNEFGDSGIDGSLVVGSTDDLIELRSGCICCTVRGDLQQTVLRLLKRRERRLMGSLRFDRLVIEASGLASPGPVLQTFLLDEELVKRTCVDGVITLAHALHIAEQIKEFPEASEQLAYADRIVLNHCDQVEDVQPAIQAIGSICPQVPVLSSTRAELKVSDLLNLRTTDPRLWRLQDSHVHTDACAHEHTPGVQSISLVAELPVDLHRLKIWLQHISSRRTHQLLRLKGVLCCVGQRAPVVVQGIYQWLELGPAELSMPSCSRLVIIGKNLDVPELKRGWAVVCR